MADVKFKTEKSYFNKLISMSLWAMSMFKKTSLSSPKCFGWRKVISGNRSPIITDSSRICFGTVYRVSHCSKVPNLPQTRFTLLFIIPRTVLLSSMQPEAETLDFSTHALPSNIKKIFPPREYKQRRHCQAI